MNIQYSLAYLTVKDAAPDEAVRIAAEAGYQKVGLRLLPAGSESAFPIMTDQALQRRVLNALAETGVGLADIEIARINDAYSNERFRSFLELGAKLGAAHVLVAGDDTERTRLIDNYGRFCELAAEYALTADLEPMPWTAVKNVRDAMAVINSVSQPNSAILIDALHFDRSDSSLEDLRAVPASKINYIQVCDGPHIESPTLEQLIFNARDERYLPGDGDIDLKAMLSALPSGKVISIEIPRTQAESRLSPLERAQEALARTQLLMAEFRAEMG